MTDLVEKLRRRAKQNPTPGGLLVMVDPGTLNEAADEIERLTSDLTRAYQEIRERHEALVKAVDTVMTLEAELVPLRALKAKVDGCETSSWNEDAVWAGVNKPRFHTPADLLAWLRETAGPPRPSLDSLLAGTEFEGQLDD